jgi:hypothetical protein
MAKMNCLRCNKEMTREQSYNHFLICNDFVWMQMDGDTEYKLWADVSMAFSGKPVSNALNFYYTMQFMEV